MEARDYAAIAKGYASDVVKGRILACSSIRRQCQRMLDDLKAQRGKDFEFLGELKTHGRIGGILVSGNVKSAHLLQRDHLTIQTVIGTVDHTHPALTENFMEDITLLFWHRENYSIGGGRVDYMGRFLLS